MSREEQIIEASRNPIFKTGLIRLDDISFIAGAQWADRTMLQEVLRWLEDHTYDELHLFDDTPDTVGIVPYHTKEQMLQSFKERFNIE